MEENIEKSTQGTRSEGTGYSNSSTVLLFSSTEVAWGWST